MTTTLLNTIQQASPQQASTQAPWRLTVANILRGWADQISTAPAVHQPRPRACFVSHREDVRAWCAALSPAAREGFEVIGVTLDVKREQLASFLNKNEPMVWPQYFDDEIIKSADKFDAHDLPYHSKLAERYGIDSLPSNFLIDRNGKIIGKNLRGKELFKAVADALEKK